MTDEELRELLELQPGAEVHELMRSIISENLAVIEEFMSIRAEFISRSRLGMALWDGDVPEMTMISRVCLESDALCAGSEPNAFTAYKAQVLWDVYLTEQSRTRDMFYPMQLVWLCENGTITSKMYLLDLRPIFGHDPELN